MLFIATGSFVSISIIGPTAGPAALKKPTDKTPAFFCCPRLRLPASAALSASAPHFLVCVRGPSASAAVRVRGWSASAAHLRLRLVCDCDKSAQITNKNDENSKIDNMIADFDGV